MSHRMDGDVAVITGAGRGIGRAIAESYAAEGAAVTIAARTETQIMEVEDHIRRSGGRVLAVPTDITSDHDVTKLHQTSRAEFGPATIIVNNAGAYRVGKFLDIPIEEFARLIEVNYLSVVRMIQTFLPDMLAAGGGSIVNIASTAGKYGSALQVPYNGSKHAVVGITRSLGMELGATGVRVNAICPGLVETEMMRDALPQLAEAAGIDAVATQEMLLQRVPMRRFLDPSEIAQLAVYVGSDESRGMTGQSITISGGLIVV